MITGAMIVRSMIADYNKFQKKLDGLLPMDRKLFLAYYNAMVNHDMPQFAG